MDMGGTSKLSPAILYILLATKSVKGLCDSSELDLNDERGLRRHDCDDEFL